MSVEIHNAAIVGTVQIDVRFDIVTGVTANINPLNAELNPIRHLLALAGAHHFVHVSRVRVNVFWYVTLDSVAYGNFM
jgi:hypothetical protein